MALGWSLVRKVTCGSELSSALGKYDAGKDQFKWYTRLDGVPGPGISQINFRMLPVRSGSPRTAEVLELYDGKQFGSISLDQIAEPHMVMSLRYMPFNDVVYAGNGSRAECDQRQQGNDGRTERDREHRCVFVISVP